MGFKYLAKSERRWLSHVIFSIKRQLGLKITSVTMICKKKKK